MCLQAVITKQCKKASADALRPSQSLQMVLLVALLSRELQGSRADIWVHHQLVRNTDHELWVNSALCNEEACMM